MTTSSPLADALAGIRVLDLTRNFAGPYCTMLLGDLGADVVKVESPAGGDDTRSWSPPAWNGVSAAFLACNRNKRSLAVDLDAPEGRAIVRRLAQGADVVMASFRPGSLEKRGLDEDSLRPDNPGLVYCAVTAYGAVGPDRDRPGYDPVLQAESGIMALTGEQSGPPVRLGIGAIDLGTALWAALGIQAALAAREKTGRGGRIEVSLVETAAWWLSYHIAGYLGSGVVPQRHGSGAPFLAPYEVFATADGELMVTAGNDQLFAALCTELGRPELVTDPAYATNADRVAHRDELHDLLAPRFARRTTAQWRDALGARAIPCGPVRTVADFVADEQLAALGLLQDVAHPDIDDLRLVGVPLSLDGRRPDRRRPPPRLGEHNAEILAELGYAPAEVADLVRRRVLGGEGSPRAGPPRGAGHPAPR